MMYIIKFFFFLFLFLFSFKMSCNCGMNTNATPKPMYVLFCLLYLGLIFYVVFQGHQGNKVNDFFYYLLYFTLFLGAIGCFVNTDCECLSAGAKSIKERF